MEFDRNGAGKVLALLLIVVVLAAVIGFLFLKMPWSQSPSAPSGLHATTGNHWVSLSWNASEDNGADISSYRVYRGNASGNGSLLAELGNVLSYNDTAAMNGCTYFYAVSAVNSVGEGVRSSEVSVKVPSIPSAPRSLAVTFDFSWAALTWAAPASDGGAPIIGYKVFRSNSSGTYSGPPLITVISLNYTDTPEMEVPLDYPANYQYYVVKAYNEVGDGPSSNEVNVSIPPYIQTISLTGEETTPGNFSLSIELVSASVMWSEIQVIIKPATAGGTVTLPSTTNVEVGNVILITGAVPGAVMRIYLVNTSTASICGSVGFEL